MKRVDLAWAAGFIDGEGAIQICRSASGQIYLYVHVTQSTDRPLLKLQTMFGGVVKPRVGTAHKRPMWMWRVHSENAYRTLKAIRPYLEVKTPHADVGIEFWQACSKRVGWNTKRKTGRAVSLSTDERQARILFFDRMSALQQKGNRRKRSA